MREGVPHEVLGRLAREAGVKHAHYIRNHTPYAKERDGAADRALSEAGVEVHTYPGQYTHPPGEVLTGAGTRYSVFGPFGEMALPAAAAAGPDPRPTAARPEAHRRGEIPVARSDVPLPDPGEGAALARLEAFLRDGEADYATARNFPARRPGTSLLSMYFNIGALGPRVAVRRARDAKWRSELAWWDFNAEVLDRQPEGATLEYKAAWRGFPWRHDEEEIGAGKRG